MRFDMRRAAVCAGLLFSLMIPHAATAGLIPWPWGSRPKGTSKEEWYEQRASDPVGARQRFAFGKHWPPYPRPTGLSQLPSHTYHAAHYWPYPYQCDDRAIVREFSDRQINNGWVTATTLYEYHFDPNTNELSRSGVIQLRWILENAPESRRFVFVQSATNNDVSQQRLMNVQTEATNLVGKGNVPPVMLRVTSPLGRPALEVDRIRRLEIDTLPTPRISDPLGATSSAAGGAGGAGATGP